jgi:hypothetical protein
MPLSPDAWASIGTSLFNTSSTLLSNAQNRKYALQDWNRQNAYNTPAQQMQRFKEAGLNPNLIYKQTNEAGPVRSTDFVAPKLDDFQGVLSKSAQIKMVDQQTRNAELQNTAIQAQIDKTRADTLYVASNTKFKDLDVERLRGMMPGLVEGVQLRNEATKQEIANKVADTNNKIAQLPILEKQKDKLGYEIDRLMRTNAFIELNSKQQLAVQKAMVKSLNIATDLNRKKITTEDFNQQRIYKDILTPIKWDLDEIGVDMSWLDKITGLAGMLLPYNMGKILPKFGK